MYKPAHALWLSMLCLIFSGCAGDTTSHFPAKHWEDITIEVQTRPARIEEGMIEFLIIASRPPAKPAHNLLITISIDDTGHWLQAIQDGHLGVYRRSLPVTDPENNVLNVRIQYDNRESTLHFPLAPREEQA